MQYAQPSDLPLYIKPDALAALTGATGTSPDDSIVNNALLEASSRLDAACRRAGIQFPITVDAHVVGLVCRLSLRALCGREVNHEVSELLQSTIETAESDLEIIATTGGGIQSSVTSGGTGMKVASNADRSWSSML